MQPLQPQISWFCPWLSSPRCHPQYLVWEAGFQGSCRLHVCSAAFSCVQAALYCVFDGHCGRKTAAACTRLLPEELRRRMPELRPALDAGEGAGAAWEEVFLATDAALDTEDGATATAVLVWKDAAGNVCLQVCFFATGAAERDLCSGIFAVKTVTCGPLQDSSEMLAVGFLSRLRCLVGDWADLCFRLAA